MIGRPESARILIAGVGNIFLGDDAFGVEVAQRLARRSQPDGVRVIDFGIRGLDLAYALMDGYEAVIIVDAVPRGQPPGTLFVLEPETNAAAAEEVPLVETHNMDPVRVLRLASSLGSRVNRLLIVGCEPETCGSDEEMPVGLSASVRAAVNEAVPLVESLAARLLRSEHAGPLTNESLASRRRQPLEDSVLNSPAADAAGSPALPISPKEVPL